MYDSLSFDQLNKMHSDNHNNISLPFEQYFGEMELTDEQTEKRIETAEDLEEVFLYGLTLLFLMEQAQSVNYAMVLASMQEQYEDVLERNDINNSSFFRNVHVPETIASVLSTTISNPEKTFNFSEDRVTLIAENEANAVWNDAEFQEAIGEGYTEKTWHSIIDKRTRDTHRNLDGVTKPILEPFEVGEYLMMYPKDESLGAGGEEIANCRCSVEYGGDMLAVANILFVNNNELLFKNAQNITPIPGFEDVTSHATPDVFQIDMTGEGNDYIDISPSEFANRIKNSKSYHGGNVRLICCQSGEKQDGAAKQVALELGKTVMAPTENVNIDEDGNIFLTNNEILADMWYHASKEERELFVETGSWKLFLP